MVDPLSRAFEQLSFPRLKETVMNVKKLLIGVGVVLAILSSSAVVADWSSMMDVFKSESSNVMDGDGLAKVTEAAGLS